MTAIAGVCALLQKNCKGEGATGKDGRKHWDADEETPDREGLALVEGQRAVEDGCKTADHRYDEDDVVLVIDTVVSNAIEDNDYKTKDEIGSMVKKTSEKFRYACFLAHFEILFD